MKQHADIRTALMDLINKGAIVPCEPIAGQFLSPYFLVPKSDGGQRFVLNLKQFNTHITAPHFKLEDLRTAQKLVSKDYYMCKLDLQDAFFLINVNAHSRKYLRFKFDNIMYEFTCLPFGLSISPFIFTKIIKPVVE